MHAPEVSPDHPESSPPSGGEQPVADGDRAPDRPRNLVICSDGTGQRAGTGDGTNVWRLYQALDRDHPDVDQLAIHDDGVGSSSNPTLAALGGSVGFGLARNVRQLYAWLAVNYRPGDRIYLFGFSRGAFTVRVLAGMIARFGILKGDSLTRSDLEKHVIDVWFAYKASQHSNDPDDTRLARHWPQKLARRRDDFIEPQFDRDATIAFVGVWDTVDAYGLPVDELKEAFAWASRKVFRFWPLHYLAMTRFNDRLPSDKIESAFHAVSIDDERHTFHPVLWDENERPQGKPLEQVWFTGAHTDVGGGYARGSLSLVPLDWMMTGANQCGLRFSAPMWDDIRKKMSPLGPMHDSRSGFASYFRYRPRDVAQLCEDHHMGAPKVHESVLERVGVLRGEEAPAVLPTDFRVVHTSPADDIEHQRPDPDCLERLRRLHVRRAGLYLLFVLWTAALVAALLFGPRFIADDPSPPWNMLGIGYFLSLIQRFTPSIISDSIHTLRGLPFYTLLLAALFALLVATRSRYLGQTRELRRAAWDEGFRKILYERNAWTPDPDAAARTAEARRKDRVKQHERTRAARLVVFAVVVLIGFWLYRWYATGTVFPADFIVDPPVTEYGPMPDHYETEFATSDPGFAIGPVLQKGQRYSISVQAEGWADASLPASPTGLDDEPTTLMKWLGWSRRDWRQPWFALLGTLGSVNGEIFPVGNGVEIGPLDDDTRLYLFVNDATCYVCPRGAWYFYRNNRGTATITIERIAE